MKKFIIVLLLISNAIYAQHLGFNGSGFFENYNEDVVKWLHDMNQPFTIRVPGGSISKFHDPYNIRQGWGMDATRIKSWFKETGFDEDGASVEKWVRKAEEQPNHSYLDDLIKLQKEFPDMQVTYVLNVLFSTPEANMQAIRYLMNGGVKVAGVEAGNEVYGKYNSFSEYIQDFEPIFNLLETEYPQVKKGLVAGANLQREDIVRWNDDLENYKGEYDAVIIHYYYTARELGEAYDMIKRIAYDENKYEANLDKAYRKAAEELLNKNLFEESVANAKNKFKGKAIWITEWNTKPSDMLNNTILNGAWQFKEMVELRDDVEYLLIHNGVSPDKYGMMSRRTKFDSEQNELLRRIGYWAFMLASEVEDGIKLQKNTKHNLQADADGEVCYYFTNLDEAYQAQIDYGSNKIASATIHYVTGKYGYSSAGTTGYMTKGTQPNYEVKGIKTEDFKGTVPKNSFGYIVIKTSE